MPSSLTADTLSATLEQQLRTLSINRLEGIVVQTSVAALTAPLTHHLPNKKVKVKEKATASSPERLPMTVSQLIQNLPTNQYWQAGRSEQWSTRQQAYLDERLSEPKTLISAQRCEQGKTWQPPNGTLTLQAITGWSQIDDDSVWDCALAIDSMIPIEVVQYNATNPQQSPQLAVQKLMQSTPPQPESSLKSIYKSRLILDVSTHPRGWQLWSLLCDAQPFALNSGSNSSSLNSNGAVQSITWLSHSAAQVSADILTAQNVDAVMTYDNQPLDIALSLASESQAE